MINKGQLLAKVDDVEIFESELNYMLQNINPQIAGNFQGEEGRKALLGELINQKLLFKEALDLKLDESAEFVEEIEKLKENYLTQFAVKKVINDVTLTDEEVLEFYNNNKAMFLSQEQVTAAHILCETEEEIKEVLSEIEKGLSFEEAAAEYSKCPSAASGGSLGTFGKGQMVPEFEVAAFEATVGNVTEPVKTQFGYHIIKVAHKKEAEEMSFEEVKSNIEQNLLAEKQHNNYMNHIEVLKTKHNIEIL